MASGGFFADTYGVSQALDQSHRYKAALDRFVELFVTADRADKGDRADGADRVDRADAADRVDEQEVVMLSSPGRTELGGNHTDHNNGRVLAAAVSLDCLGVARPRDDRVVRLVSEGFGRTFEVDLSRLDPREAEEGQTEALIRGVGAGLAGEGIGPTGADIYLSSRVAPGSGLSSSAAVEVLLGALFCRLAKTTLEPITLAKIGQAAENRFFGKPSGLMDQVACAHGGIVSIDFEDPTAPVVTPMDASFSDYGYALFVVDTGGDHADLTDDYAAVPREMRAVAAHFDKKTMRGITQDDLMSAAAEIRFNAGDRAFLRALHFVEENGRVTEMVSALRAEDFDTYLRLVDESGRSSWEYLQNYVPTGAVGAQPVAAAVALTRVFLEKNGAKGAARVHGGGFAGTIQAYIPTDLADRYAEFIESVFGSPAATRLRVRKLGPSFLSPAGS